MCCSPTLGLWFALMDEDSTSESILLLATGFFLGKLKMQFRVLVYLDSSFDRCIMYNHVHMFNILTFPGSPTTMAS